MSRYRVQFIAIRDIDFPWEVNESFESNELLQLVFQFQLAILKEYKRIVEESKRITDESKEDDIPF